MDDLNSDFFGRKLETINVRGEKIEQQHCPNQITAGQNQRDFVAEQIESENNPLAETARLRVVKSLVHLCERADEHEQDRERQQDHRQPQRGENFDGLVQEKFQGVSELSCKCKRN